MKVTVFNGSPASENSATNVIVKAFLKGAESAGAETENIFLAKHKIQQCQGCFSCWFNKPGECILQDNMRELLQLYNESDIVCFATPIYTWNMTALLKNFIDRLAPLKCPKITEKSGNYDLQDSKEKTQKFVVISNCGFPGDNNFEVLRASVACCNPSLEIYRNCGKLLKTKNPIAHEKIEQWLKVVEKSGREMVERGNISADIAEALKMQLMSVKEYVAFLGM